MEVIKMNQVLATIGAAQALQDVEAYYDGRRYLPTVNVKKHVWIEEIPWSVLADEHGSDAEIVHEWAKALYHAGEYDQMGVAEEIARECWWDDAREIAHECFGGDVKAYGEGRQGGHLVVHNIGEPNDWTREVCTTCHDRDCYDWDHDTIEIPDAERVLAWVDFEQQIRSMVDDFPYQVGWHLIVNVHDSIHEAMAHAL
jgi:hypothetical protein